MKRHLGRLAALTATGALALAGCSSSGGGGSSAPHSMDTRSSATSSPALAPTSAAGASGDDAKALCLKALTAYQIGSKKNYGKSPQQILQQEADLWASLVPLAPSDIHDDVAKIADVYRQQVAGTLDAVAARDAMQASNDRYQKWGGAHCAKYVKKSDLAKR